MINVMASFNQAGFLWLHQFVGRWGFVDGLAIFFAQWMPYLVSIAFLWLVLKQKGVRRKIYLFAEGALAIILSRGIVTTALHFFYNHPRPFDFYSFTPLIGESGSSFPSGHAAWFFALAMTVWYANRKWGTWFFICAFLISIARMYAGVHWPLDIIGGALIGIASGICIHWLLKDTKTALD